MNRILFEVSVLFKNLLSLQHLSLRDCEYEWFLSEQAQGTTPIRSKSWYQNKIEHQMNRIFIRSVSAF